MSASLTSLAYLVAAVLFILALRGLSSPVTSRQGNRFGMIGMAVAVARHAAAAMAWRQRLRADRAGHRHRRQHRRRRRAAHPDDGAAAAGRRVPLAGRPGGGVRRRRGAERAGSVRHRHAGHIHTQSLVEMSLGLAIGAITFSGSLIAFAKLQALMKRRADHLHQPAPAQSRRSPSCSCCPGRRLHRLGRQPVRSSG